MNIITWNVNGIRAVERKSTLHELLETYDPDVFLIQETKAKQEQLSTFLKGHDDYHQFYNAAEKPGYAGTSIWLKKSKFQKDHVTYKTHLPNYHDNEGRISQIDVGDVSILGVYFPNGGKSEEAWQGKLVFYDCFLAYVNALREDGRKVIWAGDVNCAHEEIDLARPKENENSIGFLPEERAWVSKVIEQGWVDVFRQKYPDKTEVYSWWHVISRARDRNVGWRIDYFFVDKTLLSEVQNIEYLNEQMGSDHCPVQLKIDL